MSNASEWYKNVYLRSDPWKYIRIQVLSLFDGKCCICKKHDDSNDVHHIWYDDIRFCYQEQFVLLCRSCHTRIHELTKPTACHTTKDQQKAYKEYKKAHLIIMRELGFSSRNVIVTTTKREFRGAVNQSACCGCRVTGKDLTAFNPGSPENEIKKGEYFLCCDCRSSAIKELKKHQFLKPGTAWKFTIKFLKSKRILTHGLDNDNGGVIFIPAGSRNCFGDGI